MITVASVWVRGQVPYGLEYVTRLRNMVDRHLTRAHAFVCLTDRPWLLPADIRGIPIATPALKGWWGKVELFNRRHGFAGRMLYLDLDSLIVDSLESIVKFPAPFALVPDAGSFQGKDCLTVVKRFNSSVMVWDAGVNSRLYDDWTPAVGKRLHGDQDWIGEQMPEADMMPLDWFPRMSQLSGRPPVAPARVVLVKKPKNHEASDQFPWFSAMWQ